MRTVPLSMTLLSVGAVAAGAQIPPIVEPGLPEQARQFDFWIGTWSVNLRVHQQDLTWEDEVKAEARIHPVLRGKALLELWDGGAIKGMSLRYFDTSKRRWVMWLDWPRRDRSGSFRLEGSFRHGRAEFLTRRPQNDGGEILTRYTFSDVTDHSLRWDDAFSRDGGRTWSNNWIMEFTRTGPSAELPPEGGDAHTFVDGTRCTLQSFHRWDGLAGSRAGTMGGRGVTLRGYRILDGCAVLLTISVEGRPGEAWLGQLTFNTYAGRSELLTLDAAPDEPARVFYTGEDPADDVFVERVAGGIALRRVRIRTEADGRATLVWEERSGDGAPWRETRRGSFR